MKKAELKKELDEMLTELFGELKKQMKKNLKGITLTGSYALGKFSPSRPDINFFLFLGPNPPAETYLALGKVFTWLIERYDGKFAIRSEFRPFKFPYPISQRGLEVFINPLLADLAERETDPPFGISVPVLHGMSAVRKVIFGPDFLKEINLSFGKDTVIRSALRDLAIFKLQLIRAPSTYNLNRDFRLLFNESLVCGKGTIGWGVEVASSDKELKSGTHLKYIKDRRKAIDFYKEHYDKRTAKSVEIILEARDKYDSWKKDKNKAFLVFTESYNLLNAVWGKLMSQWGISNLKEKNG